MEIKKENVLKVIFKNVRGWYIESEDKSGAIFDLGKTEKEIRDLFDKQEKNHSEVSPDARAWRSKKPQTVGTDCVSGNTMEEEKKESGLKRLLQQESNIDELCKEIIDLACKKVDEGFYNNMPSLSSTPQDILILKRLQQAKQRLEEM